MTKTLREELDYGIAWAKDVRADGWTDQFLPVMLCITEKEMTLCALAVPSDDRPGVIEGAITMLNPDVAILVDDVFISSVAIPDDIDINNPDDIERMLEERAPRKGGLQDAWQAGERDGISEALTFVAHNREGETIVMTVPYDSEAQVFSNPVEANVNGGRMVDAVRMGFARAEAVHGR